MVRLGKRGKSQAEGAACVEITSQIPQADYWVWNQSKATQWEIFFCLISFLAAPWGSDPSHAAAVATQDPLTHHSRLGIESPSWCYRDTTDAVVLQRELPNGRPNTSVMKLGQWGGGPPSSLCLPSKLNVRHWLILSAASCRWCPRSNKLLSAHPSSDRGVDSLVGQESNSGSQRVF